MRGIDAQRRTGMLSVHFRRIALAQGLLAGDTENSASGETPRAADSPGQGHEDAARDTAPLPLPEPCEAS